MGGQAHTAIQPRNSHSGNRSWLTAEHARVYPMTTSAERRAPEPARTAPEGYAKGPRVWRRRVGQ